MTAPKMSDTASGVTADMTIVAAVFTLFQYLMLALRYAAGPDNFPWPESADPPLVSAVAVLVSGYAATRRRSGRRGR